MHLAPWREAAEARDAVLQAAIQTMAARGCGLESTFTVTDSVRGAFVFRNGLPEALRRVRPAITGDRACHLRWQEGEFVEE
jgi:hypothetical protein